MERDPNAFQMGDIFTPQIVFLVLGALVLAVVIGKVKRFARSLQWKPKRRRY